LLAASALALDAGLARAQEAAPANAPPGAPTALAEVVVTAQHRSENLQRAAASVSVRTGAALEQQGRYSLGAILEDIPGVTGGAAAFNAGTQGSSAGTDSPAAGLTIRGIPSNAGVGGSSISVATAAAIYVDGVYNGAGSAYDIDRVEVLRGPQGTLYGRSATSGVVAIHTANPNLNHLGGDIAVEAGNYGLQHYTGEVNVPIIADKLAVRLSGNYYDRNGYLTDAVGGSVVNKDWRAKVLYRPTDDFSVLAGYAQEDNIQNSPGATLTLVTPNSWVKSDDIVGRGTNQFRQYWAEFNWTFHGLTLTYEPAYRTWQSDALNYARVPAIHLSSDQTINTPTDNFMTHEVRLASPSDGKLTWQIGALYYSNNVDSAVTAHDDVSDALQFSSISAKKTTAIGGFGEATYALAPDWRLTGGLRYDYTKVQVNQAYTANINLGGGGPPGSPTYGLPVIAQTQTLSGAAGTQQFYNTTYKLRLEHDLTPHNLVYALTSTGFSPGDLGVSTGANGAPVSLVFNSETLTAYEAGSKNRFLDNRLQVNGALFYYIYGGYQVANVNISTIPGVLAFSTMAAPARAMGAELESIYRLTPHDRIGFNLSYTQAYFVDANKQIVPGTGGKSFANYFASSSIPGVTPIDAQLSYDHDFELNWGSRLTFHGDARYLGAHDEGAVTQGQAALGAAAYVRTPSQWVGDLVATWSSEGDRYSVSAYARNIADNRYKTGIQVNDGFPGTFSATTQLADPRTYGVILRAKF
jgi:iron complex outermembrane receptor protein